MKQFLTKSYSVKIYYFYHYFTTLITKLKIAKLYSLHCTLEKTKFAKIPATAIGIKVSLPETKKN